MFGSGVVVIVKKERDIFLLGTSFSFFLGSRGGNFVCCFWSSFIKLERVVFF